MSLARTEWNGALAVARMTADALAGERLDGRHGSTYEQLDYRMSIPSPSYMLATAARPDMRPAIAVAEGLHLIAGTPHGEAMRRITADIDSVRWTSDALPPACVLWDQLPEVIEELAEHPASRRGYCTLWERGDLYERADQACAVGLQFMIRGGALRLTVTMRSNDVWHGLPYNLFAFGLLQSTMAVGLGVEPGAYTHQVGSLHIYDRHVEAASRVRTPAGVKPFYAGAIGWGPPGRDYWPNARDRAEAILRGYAPRCPTPIEEWCLRTLVEAI